MAKEIIFSKIERRQAFVGLGISLASTFVSHNAFAQSTTPAGVCVKTTQTAEGPFYFDPNLVRSDISEDRPGAPLKIRFRILDIRGCTPIAGARVDIWHADAMGLYSGYHRQTGNSPSTTGETFLRGTQVTNESGEAGFETIYPGWYLGRTVHVHYKAFLNSRESLTSQFYFPETLNEYIYESWAPYRNRAGQRDVTNATDFNLMLGQDGGFAAISEANGGYSASLAIGIERQMS